MPTPTKSFAFHHYGLLSGKCSAKNEDGNWTRTFFVLNLVLVLLILFMNEMIIINGNKIKAYR
jgi:hypothetical protein